MKFVRAILCIAAVAIVGLATAQEGNSGDSAPAPARADVTVAEYTPEPVGKLSSQPHCVCPRAMTPIVLDGDLSEWERIPAVVLDKAEYARNASGKWAGPQDCSGSMRMCWDSDFFYLAFDVTAGVFNQPFKGEISEGDCVQFAFDPLEERTRGKSAPHELVYSAALTSEGPVLWDYRAREPVKTAKVAVVRKKDSGGVFYEIGIPWAKLAPLAPGLMTSFGFTFTINASGGGKRLKSWLQWTPGICGGSDSSSFGQADFTYLPPPPPMGAAELYVTTHIQEQPGIEAPKFRIFCFTPAEENLKLTLALSCDGKEVANSTQTLTVAPGANRREVTWKMPTLAEGSYKGTISVEPPAGPKVERGFGYERMATAPLRAKAEAAKAKVSLAAEKQPALYQQIAAGIGYRMQLLDTWLASGDVKTWRRLEKLAAETDEIADAAARGIDWFANARGHFTRAYVAPEDDRTQPFRVSIPPDYDGSKPYPLIIWLHGGMTNNNNYDNYYRPRDDAPWEVRAGYLVVHPYGRGEAYWHKWGRNDVFHVLDEMKKRYKVDENRVYMAGFSMGGIGAWYLATRYPDCWAAASPSAGMLGLETWKRFANDNSAPADWKSKLEMANAEMFFLENFLDLPAAIWNGIADSGVPIENSEAAFDRLRKLGYEAALLEGVRQGHEEPQAFRNATLDWMLTFTRNPAPERVRYRTFDLRYNHAYWVEIDELIEDYRLSEVQAQWSEPGRIKIETKNVSRLTLELPEARLKGAQSLEVVLYGAQVTVQPIPQNHVLHLMSADGGKSWAASAEQYRPGCVKKHGASGPMNEVFSERFLIVYGTAGAGNATDVNRREAKAFVKRLQGMLWVWRWGGTFTVLPDNALTEAEARGANLVLFGGPESNTYARKIADALPVRVEPGKLTFRGKVYDDPSAAVMFMHPNPDAPGRYVLLLCGATPEAICNITDPLIAVSMTGPDWLTYQVKGDSPTCTEGGFFDRDWK